MKTIEYRTIDKTGWGEGPWTWEPDKVQLADEATGLPCLIRRSPSAGSLCGYVGVPEGHPWHGLDYGEIDAEVHGGLTFAGACDGDEADGICHKPDAVVPSVLGGGVYRDLDYVRREVASLARQAAEASGGR